MVPPSGDVATYLDEMISCNSRSDKDFKLVSHVTVMRKCFVVFCLFPTMQIGVEPRHRLTRYHLAAAVWRDRLAAPRRCKVRGQTDDALVTR
jgi:hypothetical protein